MLRTDLTDTAFLSWPYQPDVVRALLPERIRPRLDVREGAAWVSVVAFDITYRPPGLRCAERNVRTYVRGEDGEASVWFLAMELTNGPLAAAMRAAFGFPAVRTDLRTERDGPRRRWVSERGGTTAEIDKPADPPDALTDWLTLRFWVHDPRGMRTSLRHEPWPMHAVHGRCDPGVLTAAGLPAPAEPPRDAAWSPGVVARLGMPQPARG